MKLDSVGNQITMITEVDNPTIHLGFGYLFKVRLVNDRWVSIVLHLIGEIDPPVARTVLIKMLNDSDIKWVTVLYKHNMCYSHYELPKE